MKLAVFLPDWVGDVAMAAQKEEDAALRCGHLPVGDVFYPSRRHRHAEIDFDEGPASIIKNKFSGESRGFGFVEMPNKEEADKAIAALNGKDLKGRTITANEARPRTNKPRIGRGKRF